MAKICFLGDTHHGLRNSDPRFIEYFKEFYGEWFFPKLEELGITRIIQFGDLFDRRIGVDTVAITESKKYFFDRIKDNGYSMETLLGNHDLAKKDTLKYNSPEQILKEYDCITIINRPTQIRMGNYTADMIPWICKENHADVMEYVEASNSDFMFGHLELAGFAMYKGVQSHGGMEPSLFKKYTKVLSGHYHTRSQDGNVMYIGTPAEYVWSDAEDPKGFYVFDDQTGDMEFIQNPFTIHQKLYYSEKAILDGVDAKKVIFDHSECSGKFVKVYVLDTTDRKLYDKFFDSLNAVNPLDVKVIEEAIQVESHVDDSVDVRKTSDLIQNFIENMDTDLDKDRLQTYMTKLYIEAQSQMGDE